MALGRVVRLLRARFGRVAVLVVVVAVVLAVPMMLFVIAREVQADIHGLVLPVLLVVLCAITKRLVLAHSPRQYARILTLYPV